MNANSQRLMSHLASNQTDVITPAVEPAMVRLRLIGQMEAWTLTAESIVPTGRKTRALLAILALSAPRPVLRGRLAEMLWSRRPEEQARASLRQEIHRLLDALGPVGNQILSINRDHLMLRPGSVWVDVEEVLRASPAKPAALSLLDGDLLEDLDGVDPAFDNWLAAERERLRDRARVLAELMLRDTSDPDLIIPAAQQLLSIDRAHEGAWRALMRAYTARGERGMAVQAYERCRSVLADLLDAQPSEETQRLAAEIRASVPPPRTPGSHSNGHMTGVSLPAGLLRTEMARDLRPQLGFRNGLEPRPDLRPDMRPNLRTDPRAESRLDTRADSTRPETRPNSTRAGPRVGVLPLQLVGVADSETHLATGLADEITSALARFRWMFLISSSSLASFASQSRDETALRQSFGIDFLLDGTIQRGPDRIRVSLRLLDLRAGNQIVWSGRFDRDGDDLLRLQDEIAAEVVAQIDPEILMVEANRAASRPASEPTAYDLSLRALALSNRVEKKSYLQAGDLLRQALALEPDYVAALGAMAQWLAILLGQGWAADPAASIAEASRIAERAVMLDTQDARSLTIAGHVRAEIGHRLREAVALHDRALLLNPNLAMAWSLSAFAYAYLGELDEAERRVRHYKQLTPLNPHAYFFDAAIVLVAMLKHDHAAAVSIGREVSEMNPGLAASCMPYLAALGHLGHLQEAELVRRRLLAILPEFTLRAFAAASPFERPADLEHYIEGLRLAGVAE